MDVILELIKSGLGHDDRSANAVYERLNVDSLKMLLEIR